MWLRNSDRRANRRIEVRRGEKQGDPERFLRIDSVWIVPKDSPEFRLNGSIVVIRRNGVTSKRTVYGHNIVHGAKPLWLVRMNGLEALLVPEQRKVAGV